MDEKSDAHILDGSPVVVTFNDVEYTWRQFPRREQRKIREELFSIAAVIGNAATDQELSDMDRGVGMLKGVNLMITFCEDHHPEMNRDMDSIERHIIDNGIDGMRSFIQDVYKVLFDAWVNPWIPDDEKKSETAV